jgi:tetratricopeptide (TPR) repeat protein
MTLPFVLLLLDYWPLARLRPAAASWRKLVLEKVPLFVLAAGSGVATLLAREHEGTLVPLGALPLSDRLANAATAYAWYLSHTVWPAHLAILYPHPERNWSVPAAVAGVAVLLAGSLLSLWQLRRRPWLAVGWFWFVGTLLPVIGLAQGGMQAWADRFSYWPHIGLFVAGVWGLGSLAERFRIPAGLLGPVTALALGSLAVATWVQLGYWRDAVTVWERALAVTKDNQGAHLNLGEQYAGRGRLDESEKQFAEAVRLRPDVVEAQYSLATILLALGREEEAADHFREVLVRAPTNTDAWHNLGLARLRQGKPELAVRSFRKVLELQPDSPDTLAVLGQALWRTGKRPEALQALRAALDANPECADAWNGLGVAHLTEGRLPEATEAFSRAQSLSPLLVSAQSSLGVALGRQGRWAEAVTWHVRAVTLQDQGEKAVQAMNGRAPAPESVPQLVIYQCRLAFALHRLGDHRAANEVYGAALRRDPSWPEKFTARAWRFAADPDENLRDPRLAHDLASQAAQATGDPSASTLDALAAAEAALGEFEEAVRTAQQALARAGPEGRDPARRAIQDHLRLYKEGKSVTVSGSEELH